MALLGLCGTATGVLLLSILARFFPFPVEKLDRRPRSVEVTDRTGQVLLTLAGDDEQWRYPVRLDQMSPWLIQATIAIEDQRFMTHCGVDPLAVARAVGQNLLHLRTVSGASTITMQVCRMMENRPRTVTAKLMESFRSLQLERLRDKNHILEAYLNLAPYGGNLRGVEAAARAYYSKRAVDLSLGESALIAGLPQAPTRLRPDRHPEAARARRDLVLTRMAESGMISEQQRAQCSHEPVAITPGSRSYAARHAAWLTLRRSPSGGQTTLDPGIQTQVERLLHECTGKLPPHAHVAVVVIEIRSGDVVALVGSENFDDPRDGQNNGVVARRSPGSALKPFIYAAAFEAGRLGPDSIVFDVPIQRAGWAPQNFDHTFSGEITVREALQRSLNVPAILVTEGVGLARCAGVIESAGIDLPEDAEHRAGLSLAVGATEVSLLNLTNGYATLGRGGIHRAPRLLLNENNFPTRVIAANACSAVNEILSSRKRPAAGMERFASDDAPWFMWKTGTSSGRRDAWAVGHNHRYAIGVWVGRFSGAGDPEFVGVRLAEPLLARLFGAAPLSNHQHPAEYEPWVVRHPLPPPDEVNQNLQIISPRDGAVLIAPSGSVSIRPQSNTASDLLWFLNDHCVGERQGAPIIVGPGVHKLGCVTSDGATSTVAFTVYASLINGPSLNCRPHTSRQRIDLTQLLKLADRSPEDILRQVLGEERQAKVVARAPMPPRPVKQTGVVDQPPPPEPTTEDLAAQRAWVEQRAVLDKLRSIAEDALEYEQDKSARYRR